MSLINRLMFMFSYFRQPPWDSGQTPPELIEFLKDREPGKAIDLGCGTGTNLVTLAQKGWQVSGVDFVPAAVEQARRKLAAAGLQADVRVGDVTRLEGISGPFDLVVDLGCFHSLPGAEKAAYQHQLERILPQGRLWFMYGFLRPIGVDSGAGLSVENLAKIKRGFKLVWRSDGSDRGKRPSAYFIFEKI